MELLKEARSKVNGKFLAEHSGKPISILGQVIKVHSNGATVEIKTTDNLVVSLILNQPLDAPLAGWIDVRGTAQGKCHVIAQHIVCLKEDQMKSFDAELYDDFITIINTCNNPWIAT